MKLSANEISDVVLNLVGEIDAYGDSAIDKMRLENQKILEDVIDSLIFWLMRNIKYKECYQYSMKTIGEDAEDFFRYLVKEYELGNYLRKEE